MVGLDTRGLIIHYNTYDEVYISPVRQEGFLAALLQQNAAIGVVEVSKRMSSS
ncbi:PH domain-containing protein [Nafulsella turpanensis]|uniref:PH domain-containing protein n=1 Tax=Nafulsella turpanensis TaxID=1265690 RepID=UPI000345661E